MNYSRCSNDFFDSVINSSVRVTSWYSGSVLLDSLQDSNISNN